MKKEAEPILFKALDQNAFLDAIEILKKSSESYRNSEIFSYNKNFYFVIYPRITGSEKIAYILSDFGETYFGEIEFLNRVLEYGEKISF